MCTRHSLTHHDVLVDDVHEVVAVGPRVLVPEADHVTQLVHDDAELVAVLADADHLRAAAALADERAAPVSAPTARNIDVSICADDASLLNDFGIKCTLVDKAYV